MSPDLAHLAAKFQSCATTSIVLHTRDASSEPSIEHLIIKTRDPIGSNNSTCTLPCHLSPLLSLTLPPSWSWVCCLQPLFAFQVPHTRGRARANSIVSLLWSWNRTYCYSGLLISPTLQPTWYIYISPGFWSIPRPWHQRRCAWPKFIPVLMPVFGETIQTVKFRRISNP